MLFCLFCVVTRHLEQDLRCVQLEKVDLSKCCNINIDCPAWRSVKPLPRTVRFNFEEAITYVGDITGTGRIPLIRPYEVAFISADKYTGKNMKAYMIEDYLYVLNNKWITSNLLGESSTARAENATLTIEQNLRRDIDRFFKGALVTFKARFFTTITHCLIL